MGVPSVVHASLYHMAAEKVEGAAKGKRAQGRTRGKKTVQIKGNEVWICNITATISPPTPQTPHLTACHSLWKQATTWTRSHQ